MVKIIAGTARNLKLKAPAKGTRPTTDRTKEALFSALEARDAIAGARVLDLYAGTGALALEALSRGAVSAVLVDNAPAALACLKHNAKTAGRIGKISVVQAGAQDYLNRALRQLETASEKGIGGSVPTSSGENRTTDLLGAPAQKTAGQFGGATTLGERQFDLVFVDPPYELENSVLAPQLCALARLTSTEGWIIVERSARTPALDFAACGLELYAAKHYGETALYYVYPCETENEEAE